ncbi:hypothetical protein [Paludibacterium purpuratum]|uniref:Uncharacterized protein n=1 Tax=Paludibacterium purpuratum TaxID=1144873 RepID=A0A4R7B3R4_9NEIS|nr:hypothetical protein [Paludibacterium purpuratum]TDR78436.1 hypothetical protein DFP86_108155 [Paludibacterium purpuratum]
MKRRLAPITMVLLTCVSLSAMAEDASAPVPIHRTTAKHRVVKQAKTATLPSKKAVTGAASTAK